MNPTHPDLPVSETALLNTLIVRYGGGELLPQPENAAFLQAILDFATALRLVRSGPRPPLEAVAAWHLAVAETSDETARFIWDRYFCLHFTQSELAQIVAVQDRLRRQVPSLEFPAARRMHLEQLRASLRLDEPETGAPYSLGPAVSGERREQVVTRASLEVLRALHRAGRLADEQLRRFVETFWTAAEARERHWRRCREEETLFDFLRKFVQQTEAARQEGGGPALSEETWAWKVWVYLEDSEQHHAWLRRRLAEHVPAASARRRPPRTPAPRRHAPQAPFAADLREGLIRFFRLAPILSRSYGGDASGAPAGDAVLTSDEIRRVTRVEALLSALCPDAEPLLPPQVHAWPLLRVLQDALEKLHGSGIPASPSKHLVKRVLERLVRFYGDYDPYSPPLRLPSLGASPADAVQRWEAVITQLGAAGVEHFCQRNIQLRLGRALSVAITLDQSETDRCICASASLRRQLDTERIGLGRRRRGDLHTELAIIALKLRGRTALLRAAVARGPLPPSVAAAAGELIGAAAELADLAFHEEANSDQVAFEIRSTFDHTIVPGHGRLEAGAGSVPPVLGDPDLRRRLDAVREAAARVVWTAQDLTDGFFRKRRNVGLRCLVGRRSDDREDDLFSPV